MGRIIVGKLTPDQMVQLFNEDRCQQHLGIKADSVTLEEARGSIHLEPWHMNFEETVHGGILFSVLDSLMGLAVFPHLKEDERVLAIDLKINYLRAATLDMKELRGITKLVSRTRRLAVAEGEILAPDATIISKALGTFAVLKQKNP